MSRADDSNQMNTRPGKTQAKPGQTHTDIKHLIQKAHDVFDIESWGHPEKEPAPAPKERKDHIEIHEHVEHEPDSEIGEYIEDRKKKLQVPENLQEHGVTATEEPVQYPTQKQVKIPLSDDKVLRGKKYPISSSFRWLAEACLYALHKAHIRLKMAHGKATRIFEN